MQIGHRGGGGAVRINDRQLRAALLAGAGHVRHHVDLRRNRIAAPDHDQVGLRHLPRVDAAAGTDPGQPADLRQRCADGHLLARVAHHVAQPVDAIALHQSHRAGVVERPHRLGAMTRRRSDKSLGDAIQRLGPADAAELRRSFRTSACERVKSAGRGDGCARRNARPWRRSPRRYTNCPPRHVPRQCGCHPAPPPTGRRWRGSRADTPRLWSLGSFDQASP